MTSLAPARRRHSPCIGVCKLDDATGLCLGCARLRDEIAAWSAMEEEQRDAIWALLPARLDALAVRVRLSPLSGEEIAAWVAHTIDAKLGTWVVGAPGAVAEFPCREDRASTVAIAASCVTARAHDANFRLKSSEKLRAFVFSDNGPTVLGIPKARALAGGAPSLAPLGCDGEAIDTLHRSEQLFDFGIGRQYSRFCVRTGDLDLAAKLRSLTGRSWSEVLAHAGTQLIAVSPTRVVETAAARIEVFAPIPPAGGRSPDGAHTHLLPQFLALGEEIPAALALPDYVAPVAIFYPSKRPA